MGSVVVRSIQVNLRPMLSMAIWKKWHHILHPLPNQGHQRIRTYHSPEGMGK